MERPEGGDLVLSRLARRARDALALVALMAGAAGCFARADPGRRTWHELRTERFVLVTDLEADEARERAAELDEKGAALAYFYPAHLRRPVPIRPLRVIHLARCRELHRLAVGRRARRGMEVRGFVGASVDFGLDRLVVTCESKEFRPEIAVHELTHDLNHRYFSGLPAWLEEGLATYFQTLTLEDGKVLLGGQPLIDVSFMGVKRTKLPTLRELLAMSREQLVGLAARRGYFAAWKLTHLLYNGSADNHRRFLGMLERLVRGEGKGAAFEEAFGDVSDRVEREYATYHLRPTLQLWQPDYPGTAGGVASERQLRPGEVHALWIELRYVQRDREAVAEHLARLESEDPDWPQRLYWRALVLHRNRTGAERRTRAALERPIQLLRQYVARQPDDGQGWLGLLLLEHERLLPPDHLGVEPEAPPGLDELEEDVKGLIRAASTPSHLNLIGGYYALRRQPDLGLHFIQRALAAEPGCGYCWDTLALLYFHAGRVKEALAAQERAVAMTAELGERPGGLRPGMVARLRHYRSAAARGASE